MKEINLLKKSLFKAVNIPLFLLLIFISCVSAGLFIYAPLTLNRLIKNTQAITSNEIMIIIALLTSGYLIQFVSVFIKNTLTHKYHMDASYIIFERVFKLKYDKYLEEGPTALQDLAYNAVDGYANFLFEGIPNFLVNAITIIVTIFITMKINVYVSILMFAMLPIHYFGFKSLNKNLFKLSINLRKFSSESTRDIISIISQIDFIKQNPDNSFLLPAIAKHRGNFENVRKKVNYVANGISGLLIGLNQIIQTFIIIYLSSLALNNPSNFGSVIYVILVFPYFTNAIRSFSSSNILFADYHTSNDFLRILEEFKENDGKLQVPDNIDTLEFDIKKLKIKNNILLENIKFVVNKGDIVGIRGESGKGKSSLVKLIPKFREADNIFLNGISIQEFKNSSYLNKVSYYSQYTPIITDTILNNLNFGRSPANPSIYKKLDFLNKFNDLNEIIVENGNNLSGGDKQRIALARYFTEDAKIIIFDEPTSSLDEETGQLILNKILTTDHSDKIIFLISHNDKLLKYCNYIIEIKNKKLNITNKKGITYE